MQQSTPQAKLSSTQLAHASPTRKLSVPASPSSYVTRQASVSPTHKQVPIKSSSTRLKAASSTCTSLRMPIPPARPNTDISFPIVTPCNLDSMPIHTLDAKRILQALKDYPDQCFPQMLAGIATYGARLGYEGTMSAKVRLHNHKSASELPHVVSNGIKEDLNLHRIQSVHPLPEAYYISPLGLVPKKSNGEPSGWRKIHDLSAPIGRSVNDGIPKHYGTIMYETFQHALRLVSEAGKGAILIKRDLKSAFRFVPVSPYDRWLLLYEWEGRFYVELFLPFGLRTAPIIFNLFSEAIHWIMELKGWNLSHYIDDFLVVLSQRHKSSLNKAIAEFSDTCETMGFAIEPKKNQEGTVVDFLGLEIDTMAMEARLPPDKHRRALEMVTMMVEKRSIPSYQLEKLLGFLSFCCAVLPLGRPFLRQVFNLLNRKSHHLAHVRITRAAKRDLLWWRIFLTNWHGVAVIRPMARPVVIIYTDASGTKGIGGIWGRRAFSIHINQRHRKKHINWKEMYAVFFAVTLWAEEWTGCKVLLMCDNSAVVDSIKKKSMAGETITLLQQILLVTAWHDIELQSEWLSSEDNAIADALSRHQYERLTVLCKQLGFSPTLLRNSSHLRSFRKKLHSFFGMDSPRQQGRGMMQPPTATKPSPPFIKSDFVTPHRSSTLPIGSPKQLSKQKPKRQSSTSKVCEATTSTWDMTTQRSPILDWNESFEAGSVSTEKWKDGKGSLLPETSSFSSYNKFRSIPRTASTSKQRSASVFQPFSELANSHTTNGKHHHPNSRSQGPLSSSKGTVLSSHSLPRKPTTFAKASRSPSLQRQIHQPAQSQPSDCCSLVTQPHLNPHCSREHWVPFPKATSLQQFAGHSSTQASTQPVSLVTPYEEEQRYRQSQQGSPVTTSKHLVDGKAMQSTYTSNLNLKGYFNTPNPYTHHHSFPSPMSLAFSPPSMAKPPLATSTWAV